MDKDELLMKYLESEFGSMNRRFDKQDERFDKLEAGQKSLFKWRWKIAGGLAVVAGFFAKFLT